MLQSRKRFFLAARLVVVWLLIMLATGMAVAQDAEPPVWADAMTEGHYWVDAGGTASLTVAMAAFDRGDGAAYDPVRILPFGNGRAVWFRIGLPGVKVTSPSVLHVPHPGIDVVDFYVPVAPGQWRMQRSGDSTRVDQWPMRELSPSFEFVQRPDEAQPVFLRVQHSQPISMRWGLWDARSFNAHSKRWHVLLGGYCGFVALVLVISCVNAVSWRDNIHLYYAAYVLMLGLAQLSLSGMAGEFLWPQWAWWNDMAAVVLPLWAAAMLGPLMVELIAERGQKWISRAVGACAVAGVALSFGFFILPRGPVFIVSNVYYAVTFVFYFCVLVWFARRRPRVGLWVLAGLAAVFVGSTFVVLRNFALLPLSFATQYGSQVGVALEIPLLLIGLYFRSRERRDSQIRLSALSRVDPLTGVGSHRVLMERLDHLIERSRRDSTRGAVLRVRLANGADIRHEHGSEVWQAAQVKAGTIMARAAMEGDTVARHQDGDFIILLEGRLSRDQVADVARSIIARGLAYSKNLPPTVTLGFHIACAHAPLPHEAEATRLLEMLAAQLAEIQRHPSKALRFLGDVGSPVFSGPGESIA